MGTVLYRKNITSVLNENDFEVILAVGDLTGNGYSTDSDSIGVVSQKK